MKQTNIKKKMQNSKKKRMNENLLHCQLSHVDVFHSLVTIILTHV